VSFACRCAIWPRIRRHPPFGDAVRRNSGANINVRGTGQMVIPCEGNCFTSDNNYGCENYFYTTCYDAFDPICEQGSDACWSVLAI
jgi:hypothetical protein